MPLKQSLGILASTLQRRLGQGAAGARGINLPICMDMLIQAQTILYWMHDWRITRTYVDKQIGMSATRIDYPTELHPDRIEKISVQQNGIWSPALPVGITPVLYSTQSSPGIPTRVDFYDQIEVWPITNKAYALRIWGQKPLDAFSVEDDFTTLDPDLVFLYALVAGKSHYKQADAQLYTTELTAMQNRLKSANRPHRVNEPGNRTPQPYMRPLVVGRDV